MTMFKLYPFQVKALEDLQNIKDKVVCLAAAPGSGKTEMALSLIGDTKGTVLVLAHRTTILKTNFADRADSRGIEYCSDLSKRITITLPQSAINLPKKRLDLLVVDEAHEGFYGKQIQAIITKHNPKRIVLLTGTPSKLLAKDVKCVFLPMMDVIDKRPEQFAQLNIQIAEAKISLKSTDYDSEGDVKLVTKYKQTETNESIDKVVAAILQHAKLRGDFKLFNKLNPFKALGKTLIACNNQQMIQQVSKCLKSKGVTHLISTQREGDNSANFKRFQTEDYSVLLVLRKGILGFDMPKLSSVVDLTGSTNVDRVYQLLCRAVRKDDKQKHKLFVKVAPVGSVDWYEHVLDSSLQLTTMEGLSSYTGRRLDAKKPIIERRIKTKGKKSTSSKTVSGPPKGVLLDYFGFLKRCHEGVDKEYAIRGYTTLRCVKRSERLIHTWESVIEEGKDITSKGNSIYYTKCYWWAKSKGRLSELYEVLGVKPRRSSHLDYADYELREWEKRSKDTGIPLSKLNQNIYKIIKQRPWYTPPKRGHYVSRQVTDGTKVWDNATECGNEVGTVGGINSALRRRNNYKGVLYYYVDEAPKKKAKKAKKSTTKKEK